ncbi:MAG: hypothetical protein CR217_13610 [Beijerinckiaceae bacterium]|nr:MAG: hypothetical protein CR217_13610 [Beijerinckiaceae bacterium]
MTARRPAGGNVTEHGDWSGDSERASWLPDLEAELFVFPGSRHDDQCDSISQALLDTNNSSMTWLSPKTGRSSSLRPKFLGQGHPSEGMAGGFHSRSPSAGFVTPPAAC